MYTSNYNSFKKLFDQLGLPSEPENIDVFIQEHSLDDSQAIEEASFWSRSQSDFIKEAIQEDSEWSTIVDELSMELRK